MGPASQWPSHMTVHTQAHSELPPLLSAAEYPPAPAQTTILAAEDLTSDYSSEQPVASEQPSSNLDSSTNSAREMDTGAEPSPSEQPFGQPFTDFLGSGDEYTDGDLEEPIVGYCRNCTNTLFDHYCSACGHSLQDDPALFDNTPGLEVEDAVMSNPQQPIALLWDQRMEDHEEGRPNPHPERPDRVRAVMARLQASGLTDHCLRLDCPEATVEQLSRVHTPDLVEFVKAVSLGLPPPPAYEGRLLTSDTYTNQSTFTAARLAAGGAAAVAEAVARGDAAGGAAIVRPPGHHAESNMAMGFCFFNNAAVAARAAQAAGAQRVLILDWDVHHGNGTQNIFWDDPSVMYMSLHRYDHGTFYPGTGDVREVGRGAGEGYTVNVAFNGGNLMNIDYMCAFDRVLVPIARSYRPDLIIVSAGFDAADGDPIGGCRVTPEGFAHMTAALKAVAPIVLLLEGGYNLAATASATEACLRVLLGQSAPPLPGVNEPTHAGVRAVADALCVHRHYWPCVRAAHAEFMAELMKLARPAIYGMPAGAGIRQLQGEDEEEAAPSARPASSSSFRQAAIAAPPQRGMSGVPLLLKHSASVPSLPRNPSTPHRHHGSASRKRQLLLQIRRKAQAAWWNRHARLVKARSMSMSATPEPASNVTTANLPHGGQQSRESM